ncbi:MAG: beta-N-acetylhexosaminidase [Sandaracinaceae bacterium]|jgi:beta-N-acetylhexosaminidase|nr:beta-N-acetylhexosaminidase [Sandaracinaceae bacterium]
MSELSIPQAAGQVIIAGFDGTKEAPHALSHRAKRGELGGYVLFKRNLGTMQEVAELNANLITASMPEMPLCISLDQEGGRVARLQAPVVKLPPMQKMGALGDAKLTRRAAFILGTQLRALGFNMDYAPVLDINTNPANPVIGDRAFGSDPETVTTHALAFANGLRESMVLACGKHFPGHGDTELDSHLALPKLGHDRARLDRVELAPFRAAVAHLPSIMTAHVIFESLDPGVPATLSHRVITGLLRGELGYKGVIISDDLEMKAVADHYQTGDSACRAIEAGCDALLICSKPELVVQAQDALIARASKDTAFASRLHDAAQRFIKARLTARPEPITDAELLASALDNNDTRSFQSDLNARL